MEYPYSRFQSVLDTNHVPSPSEVTEILNLLHAPEQELAHIDAEVAKLQSRRVILDTFVTAHRALLSPIRRIPNEILAEVFVMCLPQSVQSSIYYPSTSVDKAPLIFTSVCKTWRTVSLSTPRLWCQLSFYIPYDLTNVELWQAQQHGIDLWLQRSGDLPLSLSILNFFNRLISLEAQKNFLVQFQRVLERRCDRWKTLALFAASPALMELMTAVPRENMSKLEDVTISLSKVHGATDALEESREKDFLNHFLALGSLRALHLHGYHPFDHVAGVGFKWEQLTDLTLAHATICRPEDMLTLSVALDILSRVKNLRSCTMRLLVEKDAIDQNPIGPAITLRSLQTLDLGLSINLREEEEPNQDDASYIFNRLITPSLKILTIRSLVGNTPPFSVHIPFLCLLSQPSVKIKTLNIDCRITPRSYIDCLQLTPYLKSLSLNHCIGSKPDPTQNANQGKTYSYEEFFRLLSPPDGNSPALCPELERIQFIECTSLPDPMMLLDLLKARIEGGVQSSLGDAEYFNTWMRDNTEGDCHASKSRDSGVVSGIPIALKKSTLKMFGVKYMESFDRRTITAELTGRVSRLREQGLDKYIRLLSAKTKLEDFFWDKLRMDHLPDGSLEELVLWADGTELGKPGVEYYLRKGFH